MSLDRPTPSRMPDLKPNHGLSMNKSWPCFGPRGLKIETGGYLRMKPFIAVILLLLTTTAQATEPRLVSWDIGTFHGEANSIAILDQGERFATVGSDRVIRI